MSSRVVVCCMLSVILLWPGVSSTSGATLNDDEELVTLTGEVSPAEYDDSGEAVSVTIDDGEWGLVLVRQDLNGEALLGHLGAIVVAEGVIEELDDDSGYAYAIKLVRFSVEDEGDE